MRCVYLMLKIHPSHLLRFPLPLRLPTLPLSRNDMKTRTSSTTKHVEFLWVLFCRYVLFSPFRKLAIEYLPLAKVFV